MLLNSAHFTLLSEGTGADVGIAGTSGSVFVAVRFLALGSACHGYYEGDYASRPAGTYLVMLLRLLPSSPQRVWQL